MRPDRTKLAGIRDGSTVALSLRWLEGELLSARGVSNGVPAVFVDPKLAVPKLDAEAAELARDGQITSTGRGTVVIDVAAPFDDLYSGNAAAEEAAGCWGDWPLLEISYSKLRDLHRLRRSFTATAEREEAPGCRGEMKVDVEAYMTRTFGVGRGKSHGGESTKCGRLRCWTSGPEARAAQEGAVMRKLR